MLIGWFLIIYKSLSDGLPLASYDLYSNQRCVVGEFPSRNYPRSLGRFSWVVVDWILHSVALGQDSVDVNGPSRCQCSPLSERKFNSTDSAESSETWWLCVSHRWECAMMSVCVCVHGPETGLAHREWTSSATIRAVGIVFVWVGVCELLSVGSHNQPMVKSRWGKMQYTVKRVVVYTHPAIRRCLHWKANFFQLWHNTNLTRRHTYVWSPLLILWRQFIVANDYILPNRRDRAIGHSDDHTNEG